MLGELAADPTSLRSLTVNFVAPASAGTAEVRVEVLRQGKSATQVEARVTQADASGVESVRAVALVTIGAARPSSLSLAASPLGKDLPEHDSLTPIPYIEGVTPEPSEPDFAKLAASAQRYGQEILGPLPE